MCFFFFFVYIGGKCETLECNADAFQELWHSEKERDRDKARESERDLRTWPLFEYRKESRFERAENGMTERKKERRSRKSKGEKF